MPKNMAEVYGPIIRATSKDEARRLMELELDEAVAGGETRELARELRLGSLRYYADQTSDEALRLFHERFPEYTQPYMKRKR